MAEALQSNIYRREHRIIWAHAHLVTIFNSLKAYPQEDFQRWIAESEAAPAFVI